jgi:hypothetical protein
VARKECGIVKWIAKWPCAQQFSCRGQSAYALRDYGGTSPPLIISARLRRDESASGCARATSKGRGEKRTGNGWRVAGDETMRLWDEMKCFQLSEGLFKIRRGVSF